MAVRGHGWRGRRATCGIPMTEPARLGGRGPEAGRGEFGKDGVRRGWACRGHRRAWRPCPGVTARSAAESAGAHADGIEQKGARDLGERVLAGDATDHRLLHDGEPAAGRVAELGGGSEIPTTMGAELAGWATVPAPAGAWGRARRRRSAKPWTDVPAACESSLAQGDGLPGGEAVCGEGPALELGLDGRVEREACPVRPASARPSAARDLPTEAAWNRASGVTGRRFRFGLRSPSPLDFSLVHVRPH